MSRRLRDFVRFVVPELQRRDLLDPPILETLVNISSDDTVRAGRVGRKSWAPGIRCGAFA